jgi:6-phosphogluconolactonase (cycloisomerase 2 family)
LRFGYASNNGGTNIDIFSYDANTGAVTPNGSATNISGVNSQSSLVEPGGRFYYTSNQGNNTISQFTVDQASGSLTSIGAAVGSGGTTAAGICTDPNGRWLYIQNVGTGGLRSFQINQTTGALSLVGASALPADITCAVTANGRFLVNQAGGGINVFRIDQTTGELSFDANYATTECPGGGAASVDLQGGVYCATNTQVAAFTMDETTGALTLASTAPLAVTGNVAQSAVFHVPRY